MTTKKALIEFKWMLAETEASEALAIEDQKLMGDACKELRTSHGIERNEVARRMGLDSMLIAELERRCSTESAKKYRAAVLSDGKKSPS